MILRGTMLFSAMKYDTVQLSLGLPPNGNGSSLFPGKVKYIPCKKKRENRGEEGFLCALLSSLH